MRIGPSHIVLCPQCRQKLLRSTILSYNTFGATIYSDGTTTSSPRVPHLATCPTCSNFLWMFDEVSVGEHDCTKTGPDGYLAFNPRPKDVLYPNTPDIPTLFRAIELPINRGEKDELYIRFKIWRSFNERWREQAMEISAAEEQLYYDNLDKLTQLAKPRYPDDFFMEAEMYRNMQRFDTCIELAEKIIDKNLEPFCNKIKDAAGNRVWKTIALN